MAEWPHDPRKNYRVLEVLDVLINSAECLIAEEQPDATSLADLADAVNHCHKVLAENDIHLMDVDEDLMEAEE